MSGPIDGSVGSSGDVSGGFRIAGGNLLFTPPSAQSFSPGSWVPLEGSNGGTAGDENNLGGSRPGEHTGAFRSGPSIFVQHGSGAFPSQGENHGGEDQDSGPTGTSKRARSPLGRSAGEYYQPPPQQDERSKSPGEGRAPFRRSTGVPREGPRVGTGGNNIPVGVDPNTWNSFLEFQKYLQGNATKTEGRRVVLDEKYFRRIKPLKEQVRCL